MIYCNGIPKAGTHALAKAVSLLGLESEVVHGPYSQPFPYDGPHIFITRHPRNILCSYVRSMQQLPTTAALTRALNDFYTQPFKQACLDFLGWHYSGVYVVRYEDLISTSAAMMALASHLGAIYPASVWDTLPGGTETWSGKPSDWTRTWTPELDAAWDMAEMASVQVQMGY